MLTMKEQNSIEKRLDELTIIMNSRFDAMYEYMSVSFKEIRQDIRAIHGRLSDVEEKDIDTEDRLTGVEKAVDTDSIQLLDHQKRIRRLEKAPRLAKG